MTKKDAIEILTNAIQTECMTAEQDRALAIAQEALYDPVEEAYNIALKIYTSESANIKDCFDGLEAIIGLLGEAFD